MATVEVSTNLGDNSHNRCPVHQEKEDVGIITEDSNGMGACCHRFQHVAAEGDVNFIVGNDTVQHVDELDVVWKGIAAYNVVKQILVLGIVKNNLSAWKGVFGVRRTSLALPLLVRSWSFALGASWSYLSNRTIFVETGG